MKKYYKEFDDYVSNYDLNDINIKLKYNHSYRVMSLSKKYSKKIGFKMVLSKNFGKKKKIMKLSNLRLKIITNLNYQKQTMKEN